MRLPNTSTLIPPNPTAIASELERIAASSSFRKAQQCIRLLRYVTDCAREGRSNELKEYALGVAVFDRPESFDPRTDPVVRLEARRLRLKLAEYYQHEGLDDPVVIELPKGAYIPHFRSRLAPQPEPPAPARAKPPLVEFAAAAALVVISLAVWYLLHRRAERAIVRPSIAVLGFRDLSARTETSWINPALSELLDIELGAGQQLRTVPAENVARMRIELAITPESVYRAQLLDRIGADLGIDYAVAGAYQPADDHVRLDIALFDVRSGRQLVAISSEMPQDKLQALAQDCASRIRAQLGIRLAPVRGPLDYPPAAPAAMESYARGMERLRQSDALGARPLLENAASLAPANPLVHSGLAAALSLLGLDDRARREARQAFDSSAALGRVDQLEIEGRYRQMDHDWPRAIQVYQALFTLSPDDLEYGLLLAFAQTQGGKAQDAIATVTALRSLPKPLKDDPRIDLAEAQSAGALADFARTRRAAHVAGEKAAQRGARLQYARARLLESGAMQNLAIKGYAEVRAEARGICAELGDRACVAAAYRIEANFLASSGSLAEARSLYHAVLDISSQIGNLLEKLNALIGFAYTENEQGDLQAAERDYRAAMAVGEEIGGNKKHSVSNDLGEVLAAQGRIADARVLGEEALDFARQSHDQESAGTSQALLAHLYALEGKFPQSIEQYGESVRTLREVNNPDDLARALLELADAWLAQGNAAEARKILEEVRELDRKYDGFLRPRLDLAFARADLLEGQPDEAATLARSAMNAFAASGREGYRLEAVAVLARALLARGAATEAAALIAQVPSPDGKALPVESAVEFRIARYLVDANAGRRAEAVQGIDRLAAEASRMGLVPLQNEVRVARAMVMKSAVGSHAELAH